jgi:hypothetical protein
MQKEHRQSNTIIVLGAGASIGARAYPKEHSWLDGLKMPSSQHFFYDIFDARKQNRKSGRFLNTLGLTDEGVNDFLVQAWGLKRNVGQFDPTEWRDINIEDVFTFLDIGEKMFNRGTTYHTAFSKSKEFLEDFVRAVLAIRSDGQHCEHLIHLFSRLQPQDSIISFNWDTFADHSLMRLRMPQFSAYLKLLSGHPIHIRNYVKRGVLLKLHGSFNWIICQDKRCKSYTRPQLPMKRGSYELPRFASKGNDVCNVCGSRSTKHFIVPPVSNKLIHKNSFMHQLWLIAREKLSHCQRLVFIGYTFPSTDFYSEWLFRQIYFLAGEQPEIVVVNPEIFRKNSLVSKRYSTIFRNHEFVRYKTLEEYARVA